MALANDYSTSKPVRFETESAPEILDTVTIEGGQVALVRYATLDMKTSADAPTFGRSRDVYAIRAGAPVHTLERTFYLRDGSYHKAGQGAGGRACASVADRADEFGSSMTVKGAIISARRAIESRRLYAQYAPIAERNIASHTREDFEALDADAPIEPGDLVVVVSHSKYRTGVAIKVGRTRVECLAATPSGRVANGATRTKGSEVRLLRKRIAEAPAPAAEPAAADAPAEQLDAGAGDADLVLFPAPAPSAAAAADEERPLVLVAPAVAGGEPAEAEVWVDEPGRRTVKVVYTASRTGAWVARGRILGPVPCGDCDEPATAARQPFGGAPEGKPGAKCRRHAGPARTLIGRPLADQPAGGELDAEENGRCVSGRIFASMQSQPDAVAGCTLYRMVTARVRHRVVRLHDEHGALLGTLGETPEGWFAELPDGRVLPAGTGLFAHFGDVVAAVRADHGASAAVTAEVDATAAAGAELLGVVLEAVRGRAAAEEGAGVGIEAPARPVMPMEPVPGEPARCRPCGAIMERFDGGRWRAVTGSPWPAGEHEHVAVRAAWLEQWREQYAGDPIAALLGLVDEYGVERALETLATGEGAGDTTADEAGARARAARAQLAAVLGDPDALRAIADQVERDRLGHVTEIAGPDIAGHFEARCVAGDWDTTGLERGEDAYAAATAHGPLVAGSLFARRPPVIHAEPTSMSVGALVLDGDQWRVNGYADTEDIDTDDITAAQAWATAVLAAKLYGRPPRTVVRWQQHQDPHGRWWEPVT